MEFLDEIKSGFKQAMIEHFDMQIADNEILINETRKEFQGHYTIVLFPFIKRSKKSPNELGDIVGNYIRDKVEHVLNFNVVKGFLNLGFSKEFWKKKMSAICLDKTYGTHPRKDKKVLVEFSSPNTNKPLHLGHIRNILLGWSTYKILDAAGYDVIRTQIINDRGIAVCKSMLAWQLYSNGATPESEGIKSDHFVGEYYVLFDQKLKDEYGEWQISSKAQEVLEKNKNEDERSDDFFKRFKNQYFNEYSSLGSQAIAMLVKWEDQDVAIRVLWNRMNNWCYEGFDQTYAALGVSFDLLYYESETYILGKKAVEKGLVSTVFYRKEDGSVWVDLEDEGMDQKLLLRRDGTSVYITQDLGTAQKRYEDHGCDKMIYVVGDEQEYHFKVLFETLKKLKESFAEGLYHLSYGMVDLPSGKMKSREGTVVDADDLVRDVIAEARKSAIERGDIASFSEREKENLFRQIGLGALKYFILKVDPKKRIIFNPKESVDMQGQTGPYIQNAFVRIKSVLRKLDQEKIVGNTDGYEPQEIEIDIIQKLVSYPQEVLLAASSYDPSKMASFAYELAKMFHKFYHELRILTAETIEAKRFRLDLCSSTAKVLEHSMDLLGIEMPDRM